MFIILSLVVITVVIATSPVDIKLEKETDKVAFPNGRKK